MAQNKKIGIPPTAGDILSQALVPIWEHPYTIPQNWCWTRISNLCTLSNGKAFKPSDWTETGLPIVRIQNLNNAEAEFNLYSGTVDEKFSLHGGELLFAWSGTPGTSFGAHIWWGKEAVLNQHIFRVDFNETYIDKMFFMYAINQQLDMLISAAHGGVGLQHVTKGVFESTPIPLPPLPEQRRIVNCIEQFFSALDEVKEKAQSVIDSYEARKAAILHKAFIGELTKEWRTQHSTDDGHLKILSPTDYLHQEELPCELPSNWKWIHMGAIGYTNIGLTYKPADKSSDGTIVLRSSNIQNGQMDYNDIVRVTMDIPSSKMCQKGDLLICARNGSKALVGKTAIVDKDGMSFGAFMAIFRSRYNPFIYYFLNSPFFRNLIDKDVGTSTINQVTQAIIKDLAFPFAPENEQHEIVRILDSLLGKEQQVKDAAEAVLEKIDLLKKSILARAFRGELGTNDPAEESALELLKQILQEDVPAAPKQRSKSIPKELKEKLGTELERKIVKLYFKQETDSLPAEELLSVSSKKFEVIDSLHNLEQRGILKKLPNGNYRLLE